MRIIFFAPALATAFSTPALAQQWEYLTESATGSIYYVDVQSVNSLPAIDIQRDFTVRHIWVMVDASGDSTVKYRTSKRLSSADCSANKLATLEIIDYDARGSVIESRSSEDFSFNYRYVAPGTTGASILDFLCGRSALPGFPAPE